MLVGEPPLVPADHLPQLVYLIDYFFVDDAVLPSFDPDFVVQLLLLGCSRSLVELKNGLLQLLAPGAFLLCLGSEEEDRLLAG